MPDFSPIAHVLSQTLGRPVSCIAAAPAGSSSFHSTWRLDSDGGSYFVKLGDPAALPMFEAERAGLDALRRAGALRVPEVLAVGELAEGAYLAMEYLQLQPLDRASGARLGTSLAELHRVTEESFGAAQDNFIGSTPQCNARHPSWPFFFAQRRLKPQLELAAQRGMERPLVSRGMRLAEGLAAFFVGVTPRPSLLHGDLWSGNAAALPDVTPVMFDPASYFGDRETDLALAELFGGFPESFYAAYRLAWPLDDGYETRKGLYNLYHVLNHYNLFGASYLGQARRMIDRLLAELR